MANPSESSITLKKCVGERVYNYVYMEQRKGLKPIEKRIELTPQQVANFRKTVSDFHKMDKNVPTNGTLDVVVELLHPVEGRELTPDEVKALQREFSDLAFKNHVPTKSLRNEGGVLHLQLKGHSDTHISAMHNLETELARLVKKESFDYLKDVAAPSTSFAERHKREAPGVDPANPDSKGWSIGN